MTKLILLLIEDDFDFRCDIICDMGQNTTLMNVKRLPSNFCSNQINDEQKLGNWQHSPRRSGAFC